MPLARYRAKRRFDRTPEPSGRARRPRGGDSYVIHKHAASHLHYDLRLEWDGVLKSWAVPKGPSLDPAEKRLAVEVEDHPLEYGRFEGEIPAGEYGAGQVIIWDRGRWTPAEDPRLAHAAGRIKFELHGEKLRGHWMLVRMGGRAAREKKPNWLLIKERDAEARTRGDILEERPESAVSGTTLAGGQRRTPRATRPTARVSAPPRNRPAAARRGAAPDPSRVAGARKAPLPREIRPQLATLVKQPEPGDAWLHEIKFDGYRLLARVRAGRAALFTRTGRDWTARFEDVARELGELPVESALLDGEIVVLEENGVSSFQALQNALSHDDGRDLVYYVFDLVHLDGYDLSRVPLEARKQLLAALLGRPRRTPGIVRFSDHAVGRGEDFFREACRRGLEGIVSKRRQGLYRPGRSRDWLKVKCVKAQEFVIIGFSEPAGGRRHIGALLLGVHDRRGTLHYSGRVGTGFTSDSLGELAKRLKPLEVDRPPTADAPRGRGIHWVRPRLVAEVEFTEWTGDGMLRHPSFKGLREDKPAREIVREETSEPPGRNGRSARSRDESSSEHRNGPGRRTATAGRASAGEDEIEGVRLTHPDRVLYPEPRITKRDLAAYYQTVGRWMIPQIAGRPLTLVRCPDGIEGERFFQKHWSGSTPEPLEIVRVPEKSGTGAYVVVHDVAGLIALVQISALEIHVSDARADQFERPDRMLFDLDPGPRVPWPRVIEAARWLRSRLETLHLASFVKTSGGKGLHVVVPLARRAGWDQVLAFSREVARELVREDPRGFKTTLSKAGRAEKILIDTLRNGRGATWVAPYSTRARSGAPVSMPVDWKELAPKLGPDAFSIANVPRRLARAHPDPWAAMEKTRQSLTAIER